MSLKDRMDMYENPVDIATVLVENVREYMGAAIMLFDENIESFEKLGIAPIIKVPKYNFYAVDYGYLVYALIVLCKENRVDENKIRLLEEQFVKQSDDYARNGEFFVDILKYLGITFRQKKSNFFYTRTLYYNTEKGVYFVHNSVAMRQEAIEEFLGNSIAESLYDNSQRFLFEKIGFGKNIEAQLKLLKNMNKEVVKVVHLSDTNGLNKKIFKF